MCGSSSANCCCCPEGQIFQEKICGNLAGPLNNYIAWQAPDINDYFQGTFEIFNSGTGVIVGDVLNSAGAVIGTLNVPPGNSVSTSENNPNEFRINAPPGTNGKFCINLYKRILG